MPSLKIKIWLKLLASLRTLIQTYKITSKGDSVALNYEIKVSQKKVTLDDLS